MLTTSPTSDAPAPAAKRPRVAALDGLRGFALLGMMAWHAQVAWVRGGFARMTVFFVLSGYLAARSYTRIQRRGEAHPFRTFWIRRARRLLPTSYLGVALAIGVTIAIGTLQARHDLAGDTFATLANVINWRFILAGRAYGALFERPSAFQHFWSLSVEEQCFWMLPVVLAATGWIARTAPLRRRRERQRLAVAVLAVSLGLIPFFFHLSPDTVYYGTHVRAAEFLGGVWLGLWLHRGSDGTMIESRQRLLRVLGPIGLAVLALVMVTIDRNEGWLYRGGMGIFTFPAMAAVGGAAAGSVVLDRVLGIMPLRKLGRWALSVYALHWPLFQLLDHVFPDLNHTPLVVLKLTVAITVGGLVYRYFERPLSLDPVPSPADAGARPTRWVKFRVAWDVDGFALRSLGIVSILLLIAGCSVPRPKESGDRFVRAQQAVVQASHAATATPTPARWRLAVFGSSSGLLIGYTSGQWIDAHADFAPGLGDTGLGCGFLFDGRRAEPKDSQPDGQTRRPNELCDWRTHWGVAAKQNGPNLALVIPGRWDATDWIMDGSGGKKENIVDDRDLYDLLEQQILDSIDLLLANGVEKVIITTVPQTGPGESGHIIAYRDFPGDQPRRIDRLNDLIREVAAKRPDVGFIDLASYFDKMSPKQNGTVMPDGVHVTEDSGPVVWNEFLGPEVLRVLGQ